MDTTPQKLAGLVTVHHNTKDSPQIETNGGQRLFMENDSTIPSSSSVSSTTESFTTAPSTTASNIVTKRTDYLVWDDYFMAVAFLSAMRSKGRYRIVYI